MKTNPKQTAYVVMCVLIELLGKQDVVREDFLILNTENSGMTRQEYESLLGILVDSGTVRRVFDQEHFVLVKGPEFKKAAKEVRLFKETHL